MKGRDCIIFARQILTDPDYWQGALTAALLGYGVGECFARLNGPHWGADILPFAISIVGNRLACEWVMRKRGLR